MAVNSETVLEQVEDAFYESALEYINSTTKPLELRPRVKKDFDRIPSITFHWTGFDGIDRTVHSYVSEEDPGSLTVEVNAWVDSKGRRKWQNQPVASLQTPLREDPLKRALGRAYILVLGWGRKDLTRRSTLTPLSA